MGLYQPGVMSKDWRADVAATISLAQSEADIIGIFDFFFLFSVASPASAACPASSVYVM